MAEWVGDERSQTLMVGSVRANAWAYGGCTVCTTIEPRGCGNMNAAKTAAEQALREMHDALTEHFAPVLRWEKTPGAWVAEFGCWILNARPNHWEIHQKIEPFPCRDVASSPSMTSGYRADEEQARRHAEAVLRSFGVVFRTEGER